MVNTSTVSGVSAGRPLGDSAVVIGGSIAGLAAARLLSDHFKSVTLIERDPLPDNSDPRKGVPQGRHGHGLLGKGQEVIGRYFPGIFQELQEQGASPVDLAYDAGWYQGGQWRLRVNTGITVSIQSRPFLEAAIRRRVAAIPNIRILSECAATGLQFNLDRTAVTGVLIERRSGDAAPASIAADFVVDAGGRGSRTSHWLAESGFPKVEETEVKMNVGYTSRIYRRTPIPGATWKALIIIPTPPATRMGLLLPIEGDRWIASMVGWHGDYAPTDDEGYLEFVRSLPTPTIYNVLKDAEPLNQISTHKIPSNLWRRYEKMARFPERLAVLGDALCSFNPTYAQGMSTGSIEVAALEKCVQDAIAGANGSLDGLSDRFRKRAAKLVADPWLLATGEDFRYARTEGARPPVLPILHGYLNRVFTAQATDPYVVRQFMKVMHMKQSPATLFLPPVLLRVLTARLRYKIPAVSSPTVPREQPLAVGS